MLEEFIKFVEEEYGKKIKVVKSKDGDSFEKIFGKRKEEGDLLGRKVSNGVIKRSNCIK